MLNQLYRFSRDKPPPTIFILPVNFITFFSPFCHIFFLSVLHHYLSQSLVYSHNQACQLHTFTVLLISHS